MKKIAYIHKIILDANRFKSIFFNELLRDYILKKVEGKQNIVKYYCENLLSNYYVSYMGFIPKYVIVRFQRKKAEKKQSSRGKK